MEIFLQNEDHISSPLEFQTFLKLKTLWFSGIIQKVHFLDALHDSGIFYNNILSYFLAFHS